MSKKSNLVDVSHLHAFDTDGALRETAEKAEQAVSRRGLLRGAGLAAGGMTLAGMLPGTAFADHISKNDKAILNFALTLEYLESAFYARAVKNVPLFGRLKRFAVEVRDHERFHAVFLKKTIGEDAVKRPKFDFGAATQERGAFIATSILLEDTGVKAYQGQATELQSDVYLAAALSIHPVEARHASWIRYLAGDNPAPDAFNPAATKSEILSAVQSTGFITG